MPQANFSVDSNLNVEMSQVVFFALPMASVGPVFRSSRVVNWSSLSDVEREQYTRFIAEHNVSVRAACLLQA